MKKSKFTEQQIAFALQPAEGATAGNGSSHRLRKMRNLKSNTTGEGVVRDRVLRWKHSSNMRYATA
jgi:hypothetical protein